MPIFDEYIALTILGEVIPLVSGLRLKTYDLLILEAILRRLKENYRFDEKLIAAYRKEKAGYDGERNVDTLSTFLRNNFLVIRGLRLENPPFQFQIDTLILSKGFFLILEIKNVAGTLQYDSKQRQLTQFADGKTKSYKDPIMQAEAQKHHLQTWLRQIGIINIIYASIDIVSLLSIYLRSYLIKVSHVARANHGILYLGIIHKRKRKEFRACPI
ncbi:nuclease-related domain-containing protein [Virgibacillus siamensis]|uniref:nuclease-related domain-containing protein n=1 Tax=Virgibacillus siamensis TaxID=480071 RepID=UPI00158B5583|nr:nuclease-related domain-containing protein [Virgibacillus siamensis]